MEGGSGCSPTWGGRGRVWWAGVAASCHPGPAWPSLPSHTGHPRGPGPEERMMLTWDIVNIAAVHKQVAVLGVAERRQVGGVRCTGSDVAPYTACWRERRQSQGTGTAQTERRQETTGQKLQKSRCLLWSRGTGRSPQPGRERAHRLRQGAVCVRSQAGCGNRCPLPPPA